MKSRLLLVALLAGCATGPRAVAPDDLQRTLKDTRGPTTIRLPPGHYYLEPSAYTDSTCGNCQEPTEHVPATVGLRVSGKQIRLEGIHRDSVVIHTRAGYGVLFEDCVDCALTGVTVTAGERDADGRATDAAVVIRRSTVALRDCALRDNIGDSATVAKVVVGIAGVAVREGGNLTIERCAVIRNSWDGIALYRGARAEIRDNVIDGVDKAAGGRIGGGRGVGIGLTWDAQAVVERNLVTRYWKGIGIFVNADADVSENVVEDILTWGIALWGPDNSLPSARITRNIVHQTGACGVMIERGEGASAAGGLTHNVVRRTGQNDRYDSGEPYCWQRPIARHQVPSSFIERGNLLFDNRQPIEAGAAPAPLPELSRVEFNKAARGIFYSLRRHRALQSATVLR